VPAVKRLRIDGARFCIWGEAGFTFDMILAAGRDGGDPELSQLVTQRVVAHARTLCRGRRTAAAHKAGDAPLGH
jgi:hypothetical protein